MLSFNLHVVLYLNLSNTFATKSTKWNNLELTLYGTFIYRIVVTILLNFMRNNSCKLEKNKVCNAVQAAVSVGHH